MMIPAEILIGLFGLALASMITPGPNNLVVLSLAIEASGSKVAVAFAGIVSGTVCLLIMNWFGLAPVFTVYPALRVVVVGIGSAYLAWCGLCLLLDAVRGDGKAARVFPASFWALAGFQFTNPKAWVLCVSAVSAMKLSNNGPMGLTVLAAIFGVASTLSLMVWAGIGRLFHMPRDQKRAPNWVPALLALSLIGTSAALAVSAI